MTRAIVQPPPRAFAGLRGDIAAGLTVALVAVPQCMAFAAIAGLPPHTGLYSAIVMGLVGALLSGVPKVNIGPVATTSSMLFAVLATVAPESRDNWPIIGALVAVLAGVFVVAGGLLHFGQFTRFVPRSVLIGLAAGTAILIVGSQLAPLLGVRPQAHPTLIVSLYRTIAAAGDAKLAAIAFAAGTCVFILMGQRFAPALPIPFLALVLGGVVVWYCDAQGTPLGLATIGTVPRDPPLPILPRYHGPFLTDLIVGAAAIAFSATIQQLAIAKAFAARDRVTLDPRREMLTLGLANVASGLFQGFPGTGSFARSTLNEISGAQSRLANLLAAASILLVMLLAAPLSRFVAEAAIAGLLLAVARSTVDWQELFDVARHGRRDRYVLGVTIVGVFIVPIHWAILIGLVVAILLFLRHVSRLHMVEMVSSDAESFAERPLDERTGDSAVTLLQVEGPLFFALADELGETLGRIFARRPTVTILRMRRTQEIDFSVLSVLDDVIGEYVRSGGCVILCGVAPRMHEILARSTLARYILPEHILPTSGTVFGSAHRAIQLAREIAEAAAAGSDRRILRRD